MYRVYDSLGKLVRTGFSSYIDAMSYKLAFGNDGWFITIDRF